jgi:hypothetical protein
MPIAVQMIATAIANRGCTANSASPAIEAVVRTISSANPPVRALGTSTLTATSTASAPTATALGRSRAGAIAMIRNPSAGTIGCTSDTGSSSSGRRARRSATATVHVRPITPARRWRPSDHANKTSSTPMHNDTAPS